MITIERDSSTTKSVVQKPESEAVYVMMKDHENVFLNFESFERKKNI